MKRKRKYRAKSIGGEKFISSKKALTLSSKGECPFCGPNEDEIVSEYDDTNFDCGTVSQRAECSACGSVWFELYELKYIVQQVNP